MRPLVNSIFDIQNPYGINLLTRLRLGYSRLYEHKPRHYLQDTLNPLCDSGNDFETTTQFFLHCLNFHTARQTILETQQWNI